MKENLFETYARMCEFYNNSYCNADCEIGKMLKEKGCQYIYSACVDFLKSNPKEAEEIITKWAEEHPIKTRQDVYLQLFPKALVDEDGTLKTKPCFINRKMYYTCTNKKGCEICRKNYWREETE